MKIAFPTQEDNGLDSQVHGHFGSAERFIIIDNETNDYETVDNSDKDHLHDHCQPLAALAGKPVDVVVVGGIGLGALSKLNSSEIKVYRAIEGTVEENLKLIKEETLPLFTINQTCAGHGSDGNCCNH